jgi:single-strand DNA-binding protein
MSIPSISDIAGIVSEPELRRTPAGKAVLSFRAAFNDSKYDEQQSKWVTTKTFYVDAQAWEQTAERLAETLAKGDQIYLSGRLETQAWEKDGEKKSKPVLNIQAVRKLAKSEPAASSRNTHAQGSWGGNQPVAQGDPWAAQPAASGWGNAPQDPPF